MAHSQAIDSDWGNWFDYRKWDRAILYSGSINNWHSDPCYNMYKF